MKHIHRLVYVQHVPKDKSKRDWVVRTSRTLSRHTQKRKAVSEARSQAKKRDYDIMIHFILKRQRFHPQKKRTLGRKMHRKQAGNVIVTHKKIRQARTPMTRKAFRKPSLGFSKTFLGQKRMRPENIFEKQMVGRLQRQTGMTHFQIMNLVNLGKQSDYIDIETEIANVAGHSAWKPEIYERAKKNITERLHSEQSATHRYSHMSEKDLGWEIDKYEDMAKQYYKSKPKVSVNVI